MFLHFSNHQSRPLELILPLFFSELPGRSTLKFHGKKHTPKSLEVSEHHHPQKKEMNISSNVCFTSKLMTFLGEGMDVRIRKVDFLVVQAPLFSTNPRIGTKLRWLNLYHTALVVKQDLPGAESLGKLAGVC